LNEIAQPIITVRDHTHYSISLHALLQKEAVEEAVGPAWSRGDKYEARTKFSVTLNPDRRYLELPCNQVLSMLYIGVVDTHHQ
jgi:hypothetical protein